MTKVERIEYYSERVCTWGTPDIIKRRIWHLPTNKVVWEVDERPEGWTEKDQTAFDTVLAKFRDTREGFNSHE